VHAGDRKLAQTKAGSGSDTGHAAPTPATPPAAPHGWGNALLQSLLPVVLPYLEGSNLYFDTISSLLSVRNTRMASHQEGNRKEQALGGSPPSSFSHPKEGQSSFHGGKRGSLTLLETARNG